MTITDLLAAIEPGKDRRTFSNKANTMFSAGLKFYKAGRSRYVYMSDFWSWAEKHRSMIDFSGFEEGAIGPEPDWVSAQRVRDLSDTGKKNRYKRWSNDEDKLLVNLIGAGKNIHEIQDVLCRSESAIAAHINRLGLTIRPSLSSNVASAPWEKVSSMVADGYGIQAISNHLGPCVYSIRTMLQRHCGTASLDEARQIILRGEAK